LSEGTVVTEFTHETPEGFLPLASRRAIRGGLYESWCKGCRCKMKVDSLHLLEEFQGTGPWCWACCSVGGYASYGGSPQSRTDNAYHGGRYHSAEWEG
jgi:hypothetical protein